LGPNKWLLFPKGESQPGNGEGNKSVQNQNRNFYGIRSPILFNCYTLYYHDSVASNLIGSFAIVFGKLKTWAKKLKQNLAAILIAAKDSRTPTIAKISAMVTAAYALSPIDLIPDFIPVLGYLDDLIIVPIGISITISLIPKHLMTAFRMEAENLQPQNANWIAGVVVVMLWVLSIIAIGYYWRM